MTSSFSKQDRKELQVAKTLLENPEIASKVTSFIGTPIEKGLGLLPDNWNKSIGDITQTALLKASDAAISTMKDIPGEASSNIWHKLGVAVSGCCKERRRIHLNYKDQAGLPGGFRPWWQQSVG